MGHKAGASQVLCCVFARAGEADGGPETWFPRAALSAVVGLVGSGIEPEGLLDRCDGVLVAQLADGDL